MEPMIRLENITKYYGDNVAVSNLSIDVNDGDGCIIIGPSGCGKTTTLRMINHLIKPSAGSIFINGQDTLEMKPEKLRQSIGYAIQSVGLFPHMTVASNIAIVPRLLHWPKDRIDNRIEELLNLVNLKPSEYWHKYPSQLSGGEAQRVGVTRALAADPPIVLMDEPSMGLSPVMEEEIARIIRTINSRGISVLLVEQNAAMALRLANRGYVIETGTIVLCDGCRELMNNENVKKAYLGG